MRAPAHAARCAHRVEEEIGLEARGVALVAQAHRFQVAVLDQRSLVRAAVPALNRQARPQR